MTQNGWLLVQIIEVNDKNLLVKSHQIDDAEFTLSVPKWKVTRIGDQMNRGWLTIEYHGQREDEDSVAITLPHPAINIGHNVTVPASRVSLKID